MDFVDVGGVKFVKLGNGIPELGDSSQISCDCCPRDEGPLQEINVDDKGVVENEVDEVEIDEVEVDEVEIDKVEVDEVEIDEVEVDEVEIDEVKVDDGVDEVDDGPTESENSSEGNVGRGDADENDIEEYDAVVDADTVVVVGVEEVVVGSICVGEFEKALGANVEGIFHRDDVEDVDDGVDDEGNGGGGGGGTGALEIAALDFCFPSTKSRNVIASHVTPTWTHLFTTNLSECVNFTSLARDRKRNSR